MILTHFFCCVKLERAGLVFAIFAIPLSLLVFVKNSWLVYAINTGVWVHIAEHRQYENLVLLSAFISAMLSIFTLPAAIYVIFSIEKRHHTKLRYLNGIYYFFLVGAGYKVALLIPTIKRGNQAADVSLIINIVITLIAAYVLFILHYLHNLLKQDVHHEPHESAHESASGSFGDNNNFQTKNGITGPNGA